MDVSVLREDLAHLASFHFSQHLIAGLKLVHPMLMVPVPGVKVEH